MIKLMMIRSCTKLVLVIALVASTSGCLESSFDLAPDSRLPRWFKVPEGMTRSDVKVTMDYYSTFESGECVFKLYKKNNFFASEKVIGIPRFPYSNYLKNPPAGFPKGYPMYAVITVNGITDIIEHRKMEPVFYVTDDPRVWKEIAKNPPQRD